MVENERGSTIANIWDLALGREYGGAVRRGTWQRFQLRYIVYSDVNSYQQWVVVDAVG